MYNNDNSNDKLVKFISLQGPNTKFYKDYRREQYHNYNYLNIVKNNKKLINASASNLKTENNTLYFKSKQYIIVNDKNINVTIEFEKNYEIRFPILIMTTGGFTNIMVNNKIVEKEFLLEECEKDCEEDCEIDLVLNTFTNTQFNLKESIISQNLLYDIVENFALLCFDIKENYWNNTDKLTISIVVNDNENNKDIINENNNDLFFEIFVYYKNPNMIKSNNLKDFLYLNSKNNCITTDDNNNNNNTTIDNKDNNKTKLINTLPIVISKKNIIIKSNNYSLNFPSILSPHYIKLFQKRSVLQSTQLPLSPSFVDIITFDNPIHKSSIQCSSLDVIIEIQFNIIIKNSKIFVLDFLDITNICSINSMFNGKENYSIIVIDTLIIEKTSLSEYLTVDKNNNSICLSLSIYCNINNDNRKAIFNFNLIKSCL